MNRTMPLIAVLDDEPGMCQALSRLLKSYGFEVETFTLGRTLLSAFASRLPDCLLLDLHMPDLTGFDVLQALAASNFEVPVVVITGQDRPEEAVRARALGAVAFLLKPMNEQTLLDAIDLALARNH